jgi:4-hydroxybenzoate polyprenyltransferase
MTRVHRRLHRPAEGPRVPPDLLASRDAFTGDGTMLGALLRAMRPHQWAKNALVFVPLVAAHQALDPRRLTSAALAFVAFCLCASGGYLLNDILDIEADKIHPAKCRRPIASGEVPIPVGLVTSIALLGAGLGLAAFIDQRVLWLLLAYSGASLAYSLWLKKRLMVDVLVLAGLYTLRILAGGAATSIRVSSWLMAFSMFMFLSLALAKRYTELSSLPPSSDERLRRRGYGPTDIDLLRSIGPTAGCIASLVAVLYINLSPDVAKFYPDASALYLIPPIILYWIVRVWFLAQRRQLDSDPVVFALRDRHSLVAGLLVLAIFIVASTWHPGLAG